MKVTIEIDCDNAAFADGNLDAELGRILRELAIEITRLGAENLNPCFVSDENGNRVGEMRVSE